MLNGMPLRQALSAIVIFVLVAGSLVALDRGNQLEPVRDGLTSVISPVTESFFDVTQERKSDSQLEAELATVTAERDGLVAENAQLKSDLEASELYEKQQAASQNLGGLDLGTPVKVIGSDPTGQQRFLLISQGSADGIQVGAAVVDPNYYIGQVIEVYEHTSKVMLLIDSSQKVGAEIQDIDADGVCIGRWQQGGYLEMRNIETTTLPKDKNWIVTSAQTESSTANIPPNIPIGQVVGDAKIDEQSDEVSVEIRPGRADWDHIEYVWVVRNYAQN